MEWFCLIKKSKEKRLPQSDMTTTMGSAVRLITHYRSFRIERKKVLLATERPTPLLCKFMMLFVQCTPEYDTCGNYAWKNHITSINFVGCNAVLRIEIGSLGFIVHETSYITPEWKTHLNKRPKQKWLSSEFSRQTLPYSLHSLS